MTGADEEELEKNKKITKGRISFYASTRSYGDVMKVHGWEDTHEKLYRMSVDGKWGDMSSQITDEMLDNFAVIGTYDDIADKIKSTYGRYADSVGFSIGVKDGKNEEALRSILHDLKDS